MTELRSRMIADMQLAGLSPRTQNAYIRVVRQLAAHYRLSPDELTERQLRDYIMHLREVRGVAKGTFQQHFFGIKFLFANTLARDWPLLTMRVPEILTTSFPEILATFCGCEFRYFGRARRRDGATDRRGPKEDDQYVGPSSYSCTS